jgi:formylglycine-generating enzyme required for sulfatase activity
MRTHKYLKTRISALLVLLMLQCTSQPRPEISVVLPDGTAVDFVYIQPGEFMMGSPPGEQDRHGDEGPLRSVQITKGFYLGKYELTQVQWMAVMEQNPSVYDDFDDWQMHPVDNVSWNDCHAFIDRLNGLEIGTFRMPTEAEWEYACRAGATTRFYWGDDPNGTEAHQYAWAFSRAEARSHPVGLKKPNAWGLYDMSGNVWEWCSDWRGPYEVLDTKDPTGHPEGTKKIYRGGSWFNKPSTLRSANRNGHEPDIRGSNAGLRLVMELPN